MLRPPLNFDSDPLALIYDVARMIRRRADQIARHHGTTRAQWVVLARLAKHPGLTQAELAAMIDVEPITIARLIDRMEGRGVVERRQDPRDRRLRRLFLTEQARPLLDEIHSFRSELDRLVGSGVSDEELTLLVDILRRMKGNFSDDKNHAAESRPLAELIQP